MGIKVFKVKGEPDGIGTGRLVGKRPSAQAKAPEADDYALIRALKQLTQVL